MRGTRETESRDARIPPRTRAAGWVLLLLPVLAGIGLAPTGAGARPEEPAEAVEEISWLTDVMAGFEKAAKEKKVLMICINARDTAGEKMETAAKALRDVVYKDPAVVAKAREFVCVFLTPGGSSDDYGELRLRFGIEGDIVSPQHVFAEGDHLMGEKPLLRRQYWRYGAGEAAIKAMLALMDKALVAYRVQQNLPDPPPPDPQGRTTWIGTMLELVRGTDVATRLGALRMLVENDNKDDCTSALVPLVTELGEAGRTDALRDVVRVLGVPGLEAAALALHPLLGHKDETIRGNVAVTLEYIGSRSSAEFLLAQARKEKDVHIANHIYRALGRCGRDDPKAVKRLLSRSTPKKDEFACYGPAIGLGYLGTNAKAARSIERKLAKLGSPFRGTDYGEHIVARAILIWGLGELRDPKSAKFIREKLMKPLEEEKAWAKERVLAFYEAVAKKCEGVGGTQPVIESGVYSVLWYERGRELLDEYRIGRSVKRFAPKGEWGRRPDLEED